MPSGQDEGGELAEPRKQALLESSGMYCIVVMPRESAGGVIASRRSGAAPLADRLRHEAVARRAAGMPIPRRAMVDGDEDRGLAIDDDGGVRSFPHGVDRSGMIVPSWARPARYPVRAGREVVSASPQHPPLEVRWRRAQEGPLAVA